MMRRSMFAAAAAVALSSGASLTPASAELSGQTAELAYFEGSWACTGRRFATPQTGEQPFRATYDFTSATGGTWLETHYFEEASPENPFPLNIQEFWGYDGPADQFRNRWVSNFSTSGTFEAAGWIDQQWTWETDSFPMGDIALPMRAPFRMVGPDTFEVQPSIQLATGNWQVFAEFSCERK